MAVLEDIRKKGGAIITIVIGIALLSFVIGDFLPNRGPRNYNIAEIDGDEITVQEYEDRITAMTNMYKQRSRQSSLDEYTTDMIREQTWQMMIDEKVLKKEYARAGLSVSSEELFEMVQGPNPSPSIRQIPIFADPQTGEFDRARVIEFLKHKNEYEDAAREWSVLEKGLLDERYAQKFSNAVSNGMYVPAFVVENEDHEINRKVDFDYIVQPYSSIPDSMIQITASDLKKYYEKNKQQWEQSTSRDIEYVVFEVKPSDEDRAAASAWIENIKPEFEQAEDAGQFVNLNSKVPFDSRFLIQEQLPVQVAELFDAAEGTMVGPYQEGESLKLVRLVKAENRPDSVKVRQIVVVPQQQTQQAYQEAVTRADSIKTAIENGANFISLALKYSADPNVSTNNGDIGWIHEVETPAGSGFELLFSIKKGEVLKVDNPQGIMLMQVTERGKEIKKVQIATLQYNIFPSSRTEQIIYSQASKFALENRTEAKFDEVAGTQNLSKRTASHLGENDRQIPGLSSARKVVQWAYEAKKGEVSDALPLEDAYVVAVLKNIRKKGIAPFAQVASEIDFAVRKEKKAGQIVARLAEASKNTESFVDMAADMNLPVESAAGVSYSAFSVPGAGVEPNLIATATTMEEGQISRPIEGMNGVYLILVKQVTNPDEDGKEQAKSRLSATYVNRSATESVQALRKVADVEDMRSKFY
jgi:peptidyl-prolyl cis-trans isomerase D